MTHGSLFSGIGGFDLGFEQAGFKALWAVEKEPFCQKVLRTHFPETELFSDVSEVGKHNLKPVDVLTAGFPCQDLSVAGKRAGLEGARSGLFWEVVRILGELRPAWFVLENVPGLFSSGEGRDFGIVLNALDELGYGVAWRVLNSQFFGVAQRRRRVFIVGCFGKPCPAEVLFEPESGCGDIEAGGEERAELAEETGRCADIVGQAISSKWAKGSSGPAGDEHHYLVVAGTINSRHSPNGHGAAGPRVEDIPNLVVATLNSGGNSGGFRTEPGKHIVIEDAREIEKGQHGLGIQEGGPSYTLDGTSQHAVAFNNTGRGWWNDAEQAATVRKGDENGNGDARTATLISSPTYAARVRDFTGLPAGMDSARYRCLGNAVTVSVAKWVAERIAVNA